MSTTGARLASLSGLTGVSAKTHLMALAAGATTGERLVARSGLTTGTAMDHLMANQATTVITSNAGGPRPAVVRSRKLKWWETPRGKAKLMAIMALINQED
jgi:hypothetical protein